MRSDKTKIVENLSITHSLVVWIHFFKISVTQDMEYFVEFLCSHIGFFYLNKSRSSNLGRELGMTQLCGWSWFSKKWLACRVGWPDKNPSSTWRFGRVILDPACSGGVWKLKKMRNAFTRWPIDGGFDVDLKNWWHIQNPMFCYPNPLVSCPNYREICPICHITLNSVTDLCRVMGSYRIGKFHENRSRAGCWLAIWRLRRHPKSTAAILDDVATKQSEYANHDGEIYGSIWWNKKETSYIQLFMYCTPKVHFFLGWWTIIFSATGVSLQLFFHLRADSDMNVGNLKHHNLTGCKIHEWNSSGVDLMDETSLSKKVGFLRRFPSPRMIWNQPCD